MATSGYDLPKGQWIIEIDAGIIEPVGTLGSSNIPALSTPDSTQIAAGIDLLVGNIARSVLPATGYGGTPWLMITGGMLVTIGTIWMAVLRCRKKKVQQA